MTNQTFHQHAGKYSDIQQKNPKRIINSRELMDSPVVDYVIKHLRTHPAPVLGI